MAGIYVHIPFCHAKCSYCDFYSIASTQRMEAFISHLIGEYETRRNDTGPEAVETLYFGGGTPSILPPSAFSKIISAFEGLDCISEFTIEVNPEDVSAEKVDYWRSNGVNRISIGVQSLVDSELKAVRRRHTAYEALKAIDTIRSGGIHNVSADLIYGLPGQTLESWRYSLEKMLSQGISHLSAYTLSFEPGTLLWKQLSRGEVKQCDEEVLREMYGVLCSEASAHGFEHYEISNFGLPGHHSRHNSSYWDGTPYLGLGPGAHSLDYTGVRRFNPSNLSQYLSASPGKACVLDEENETDRTNDIIITALRTAKGLDLERLPEHYRHRFIQAVQQFVKSGKIIHCNGNLVIPEKFWLISDSILRELILD